MVDSEWLIHGGDGRQYKPEDYLTAFTHFVNENADQIAALQILLARPSGWGTGALGELRTKLRQTPISFTEDNLQRAHQVRYHKALADIISMVKHAAKSEEPLLTAEERVTRAVATVTAGEAYTEEQRQWLGRIQGASGGEPVDGAGAFRRGSHPVPRWRLGQGQQGVQQQPGYVAVAAERSSCGLKRRFPYAWLVNH